MNEEYPSPDQRFVLLLGCNEMRMSHWVCSPMLQDKQTQDILFEAGSLWDAGDIKWSEDSRTLSFYMRKYPGHAIYDHDVVIDLITRTATVTKANKEPVDMPLRDLSSIFR